MGGLELGGDVSGVGTLGAVELGRDQLVREDQESGAEDGPCGACRGAIL
jgi:hypothetical protein